MFLASVVAFCAGIYLQTVYPLSPAPLFFAALAIAAAIPLVMARYGRVSVLLLLVTFMLCGAARLAFTEAGLIMADEDRDATVYEGQVMESSARMKVLSLSEPAELKGMRVVFLSALDLEMSRTVRIFGRIRALAPTFKNPGSPSWKLLKRLEGVAYEVRGNVLSTAGGDDPLGRMRRYFKERMEVSGAPNTDILKALTIGDRASVPQEKNDLFLHTGTSHVLAISGFNVSIISGFFFFVVRVFLRRVRTWRLSGRDRRYAALLAIPFPLIFMGIAGSGVSVIRATIMIVVFMLALFLERERHFFNTLALAALIILLLYPHSLLTPSFQLTFMSLLFIVLFMQRLSPLTLRLKSRALGWTLSTLLSTAAATAGTAPIVLYYFWGINPLCLLHNLVTIPLMGVGATGLSLVGMTCAAGRPLLILAGYAAGINIAILRSLDFGYLYPLIRPCLSEILLYYGLVITLLYANRKPVAALLVVVLIPLSAIQVCADYRQRFNSDLAVNFIDVGMGDAALIEAPGGMRILIDGGGFPGSDFDVGKQVVTPFLLYRKVRTLDYVINTHPHADHLGGLPYVLSHFTVSHLVTAGLFPEVDRFMELARIARSRGVTHLLWRRGDGIRAGPLRLTVLYPGETLPRDNLNNTSLVVRVEYGDRSFLLPGDIEADVEEGLVLSGAPLKADVLKLPHHGSTYSNTFAFIYAVSPKLAVLSGASGSIKNLPGPAALARYRTLSIPVLRTDTQGLIEVRSDGKRIRWWTYVK